MSSTERLRAMLDERGESYVENDFGITWRYYSDPHTATESMDGTLQVTGLTPEQAIAATLGAGTCKVEDSWQGETEVVEYHCTSYDEYMCVEVVKPDGAKPPRFCPNCGAKVVDE